MKVVEITNTEVKNINDTGDLTCKCDSWLNHWEKFSSKKVSTCSALHCTNKVDVGAHVIKCNSNSKEHYIVPLCHHHNQLDNECFTISSASLVSANVSETCDT